MPVAIRPERSADRAAIFEVVARAFPTDAEARLVDRLRDAGAAAISLVAEEAGAVVGHILFSPVRVAASDGSAFEAIGLAPLAVAPELQKRGIGGALIRAGLDAVRAKGHAIVFVLGHPAVYYPRFGFEPAASHGFAYEGGSEFSRAFFVCGLAPGALAGRSGVVSYRTEFADL